MPRTRTGKRSARFRVQIVEHGNTIDMFFDDYDMSPIEFKRSTGISGPRAFKKLETILDRAEAESKDEE